MKLNKGDTVYRIIKMPAGSSFDKYGIHKYTIKSFIFGDVEFISETGQENTASISYFIRYGIFETEYTAKLGLYNLYFKEYCDACDEVKVCEANWNRFVKENPEMFYCGDDINYEIQLEGK